MAHGELVKRAIIPISRFEGMREASLVRLSQQLLLTLVRQKLHLEVAEHRGTRDAPTTRSRAALTPTSFTSTSAACV